MSKIFSVALFLWIPMMLAPWAPLTAKAQEAQGAVNVAEVEPVGESDPVIAHWRDGEIRQSEFTGWLQHRKQDDLDTATRQAEMEQMLLTKLLAEAARERGTADELAAVLRNMEYAHGQRIWRRAFDAKVEATDEELDRLAKANATAFDQPRRVRLRNIFLRFPENAGEVEKASVREEMAELQRKLASGVEFEVLARRHSDSESRYRGGLMSVVSPGELPPRVDEVVMALAAGQISEVLETPAGLMLLKCDKVHEAEKLPLAEVRKRIAYNLRRMRVDRRWQAEKQRWLDSAKPVYDLETALDPDSKPEAAVLRFAGALTDEMKRRAELTVGDLEVMLAKKFGKPRPKWGQETLRQQLEDKAIAWLAWQRAREEGLVPSSEVAEPVLWRQRALLAAREVGRLVQARFEKPGNADVKALFESRPEKFQRLPHFELELILLDVDSEDPLPSFQLAERLIRQVNNGEHTFAAAAREYSRHPSASKGGSLGMISRRVVAQFGPDPYNAVTALEPGEISTPVRHEGRLWIFRLQSLEERRPLSLEEAYPRAEKIAAERRLEELQREILAGLRADLAVRWVGAVGAQ